eukprot:scaffold111168_cov60-Phaeocystis_antarctica.AAC.1
MLTEERLCRRHPVAKRSSRAAPHGSTRHSAGCSARASELSNFACAACAQPQPYSRRAMPEHV